LEKIKKLIANKKIELRNIQIKVPDKIIKAFNKIGYDVEYKLFNTANYGVPQKRERVIFIAVRKDTPLKIILPDETHNKNNWVSVEQAIDDLKNLKDNIDFSHIITKHNKDMLNKIKNTPIGSSANPKYKEAWFKCYPNQPSNTVKENHGGVFLHYEKNRCMTPRELARLQSFSDEFIFKGSKSSQLKQIGNAVPPLFAENIAACIKKMYEL
jgi:DNA (cytosine-5)-methyltransferase 1